MGTCTWTNQASTLKWSAKLLAFISADYARPLPEAISIRWPLLVQIAYGPVRACKLLSFMQRRIDPIMEICVKSGLPIAMVPCLHQTSIYIKRKLWRRRTQKCKPFVGAKSTRSCTGLQTTRFHAAPYLADNGNLGNSGQPFALIPCLHQNNIYIKRKQWGRRTQKCKPFVGANSVRSCTGLQTTRFHAAPYLADNGNLWIFGATYRHGTMIAPKQCSYQAWPW